jgi:hypothetical protein
MTGGVPAVNRRKTVLISDLDEARAFDSRQRAFSQRANPQSAQSKYFQRIHSADRFVYYQLGIISNDDMLI